MLATTSVLRIMCKRVGTPLSAKVKHLAERGEWQELLELKCDPAGYGDAFSYWADAMCVDLLRKCVLPTSVNTAQAAIETFLETERDCYRVNQRIRTLIREDWKKIPASDWAFIDRLDRWKRKIRFVMGKVPRDLVPTFSGGATTSTSRLESTIPDKLSMTPEAYHHSWAARYLFSRTGWAAIESDRGLPLRTVGANEYFTVPKSGLTDRSCCKEAVVNVAYQLAVGRCLRGRARKCLNIDLNLGAELHVLRAREGAMYGHLATLDMSSASDRWARELVRYLVPEDWGILLDDLRATHTSFGGKRLYLEKFSSMGNGFTFELETILFATLAHVVMEEEGLSGEILCYGDDLIVPSSMAIPLIAALQQVGHKPNQKKSFLEGPFRESCGGDFFGSSQVNTVKLERLPEEPHEWISLANNLRRVCDGDQRRWALIMPVWKAVVQQLPAPLRMCRGPVHLGDQVVHDRVDTWVSADTVMAWVPVVARRELSYYRDTPRAIILSMTLQRDLPHGVPLRKVEGYRRRRVPSAPGSDYLPGSKFVQIDRRLTVARESYELSRLMDEYFRVV